VEEKYRLNNILRILKKLSIGKDKLVIDINTKNKNKNQLNLLNN
jgi:hypothetical protein